MPKAQNKPDIDAHRFAGVLAGFDVCNASDEEALTKGLALRRMAVKAGMRIVDLLEVPKVREAIDAQLSPKRGPDPALQEALELTSALQEELTERTRDVGNLAEQLRRQEAKNDELVRALSVARSSASTPGASPRYTAPSPSPAPARSPAPAASRKGIPMWSVQLGAAAMALGLLISSVSGHFHEGGQTNGLGNTPGASAPLVHKDRAVRPVRKRRAVPHGVRGGGTNPDAR